MQRAVGTMIRCLLLLLGATCCLLAPPPAAATSPSKPSSSLDAAQATLSAYREQIAVISKDMELAAESSAAVDLLLAEAEKIWTGADGLQGQIDRANALQLEQLQEHLVETQRALAASEKSPSSPSSSAYTDAEKKNAVTKKQFRRLVAMDEILGPSEKRLQDWINTVIDDELKAMENDGEFDLPLVVEEEEDSDINNDLQCVTPLKAIQEIQEAVTAFTHDGIGMDDHAAAGGTIVHKMTDPTFTPRAGDEDLLGNVWWRKFIPEDWEQSILPEGWETWDTRIPTWAVHTFNLKYRTAGGTGSVTNRPETILNAHTLPGSCWPMSGTSGTVTIALSTPIIASAISVDHASAKLLQQLDENDQQEEEEEEPKSSAPRHVRVYGFAPCKIDDGSNCSGLGFDSARKFLLVESEYDAKGPSIQTFPVVRGKIAVAADEENIGGCGLDEPPPSGGGGGGGGEGSCSAPPAARLADGNDDNDYDGSTQKLVAAVQLHVVDNWGNPDYTCIYRFRVHGQQVGA